MGQIVVLAKLVQCLWRAGNDAAGDALLDVGEPIEAFAAHHRVGNDTFFAQPLQRAGAYFQQVGQLLAPKPDFRSMLRSSLFLENVIGDSFDLLAQILIDLVVESYYFHFCCMLFFAAKIRYCRTAYSIVGNDTGIISGIIQKRRKNLMFFRRLSVQLAWLICEWICRTIGIVDFVLTARTTCSVIHRRNALLESVSIR